MQMQFRIIRSKILEGLAAVQNTLADDRRNRRISLIAEAIGEMQTCSSTAFRNGLVEEYNRTHNGECPICGGSLHSTLGPDFEDIVVCDRCHNEVTDIMESTKFYRVSERGMAEFVRKRLGFGFAQPLGGGNYRLGKFHGKSAFFCVSPSAGFFNTHNKDTVLILCDVESVPRDWTSNGCHAFQFAELFYDKRNGGDIGVAEDLLDDLKPKEPNRRFGKNRLIHKRRDCWLTVLMNIFADAYQPGDFRNGELTTAAARKWFSKVIPRLKMCDRSFKRDMQEFRTYDKATDTYDKREPLVTQLIKTAADPTLSTEKRLEIANGIKTLLEQARKAKTANGGRLAELPETAWATGADGRSERVVTASNDAFYATIDRNLAKTDKASDAA